MCIIIGCMVAAWLQAASRFNPRIKSMGYIARAWKHATKWMLIAQISRLHSRTELVIIIGFVTVLQGVSVHVSDTFSIDETPNDMN